MSIDNSRMTRPRLSAYDNLIRRYRLYSYSRGFGEVASCLRLELCVFFFFSSLTVHSIQLGAIGFFVRDFVHMDVFKPENLWRNDNNSELILNDINIFDRIVLACF